VVEHSLGKGEVARSIRANGTKGIKQYGIEQFDNRLKKDSHHVKS
jgi:hypothetical protein